MRNILLINRCKTDNIGDRAIGYTLLDIVKEISPSDNIFLEDLVTNTEEDSYRYFSIFMRKVRSLAKRIGMGWVIQTYYKRGLYKVLKTHDIDIAIIGGGELIQSNEKFAEAMYKWVKKIRSRNSSTKIILYGVGVTSNHKDKDQMYYRYVLKNVSDVYVRDYKSKDNLKALYGVDSKVVPDVVYSMQVQLTDSLRSGVLYGITNWQRISRYGVYGNNKSEYYQKSESTILELTKTDNVSLFNTTYSDYRECLDFQKYLYSKYGILIPIVKISSLDDLINAYTKVTDVYSPRMHGCIIGDICGANTHPIIISPKMQTYKKIYGDRFDKNVAREMTKNSLREILI